jgi:hypothetical protein
MPAFTVSRVLVLVAVIIFVLAAFGVGFAGVGLVPLGLAVWAASQLVP